MYSYYMKLGVPAGRQHECVHKMYTYRAKMRESIVLFYKQYVVANECKAMFVTVNIATGNLHVLLKL